MTYRDEDKASRNGHPIVGGEGPHDAEVMLIGQNPGREEARQGRPFVGRSGRYLDGVFLKCGLDRKKLYITAAVKETTPKNRKPTRQEIQRWSPVLVEEIKQVRPRIILLMGEVAWGAPRFEGIEYIETYHPAAAMRFPKIREKFEKDMALLAARIRDL